MHGVAAITPNANELLVIAEAVVQQQGLPPFQRPAASAVCEQSSSSPQQLLLQLAPAAAVVLQQGALDPACYLLSAQLSALQAGCWQTIVLVPIWQQALGSAAQMLSSSTESAYCQSIWTFCMQPQRHRPAGLLQCHTTPCLCVLQVYPASSLQWAAWGQHCSPSAATAAQHTTSSPTHMRRKQPSSTVGTAAAPVAAPSALQLGPSCFHIHPAIQAAAQTALYPGVTTFTPLADAA